MILSKYIKYLFFVIFLTSCGYYPQMVDVPLIKEKNNTKISAGASLPFPSVYATVSYGLTNHIAVQAAGNISITSVDKDEERSEGITNDKTTYKERYYLQAAAGYYNRSKHNRIYEIYGGYGYGNSHLQSPVIQILSSTNVDIMKGYHQQCFVQFNYGFIAVNEKFEFGMGIKVAAINFNTSYKILHYSKFSDFEGVSPQDDYNEWGMLIEPIVFLKRGKHLKFDFKANPCYMRMFTRKPQTTFAPVNVGLGISYEF